MNIEELLEKNNLKLEIPEAWNNIVPLGDYTTYTTKTIDGNKVYIFSGTNSGTGYPSELMFDLKNKRLDEYLTSDTMNRFLSSFDETGKTVLF